MFSKSNLEDLQQYIIDAPDHDYLAEIEKTSDAATLYAAAEEIIVSEEPDTSIDVEGVLDSKNNSELSKSDLERLSETFKYLV